MKRSTWFRLVGVIAPVLAFLVVLYGPVRRAIAAPLREARLTKVVQDVRLLPAQAAPRPASENDTVRDDTGVRTGSESRAELTFTDQTITRLGANTIFSFDKGSRTVDLSEGALLLAVPKGAGGAKITTSGITAGITGTTVMLEYHAKGWSKYIVLEGHSRICRNKPSGGNTAVDSCREMDAGQILIFRVQDGDLPEVKNVDLKKVVGSALLITAFRPLPTLKLIQLAMQNQQNNPPPGGFEDPTGTESRDQLKSSEPGRTSSPFIIHTPPPTPPPTPPTPPPTTPPPLLDKRPR